MLRFPEPTGALSCEVKSDFDPLTSSIRKDHGDLNGVARSMSCCVDDFCWLILVVQDASIDWTGLERRTG